MSEGMEGLTDKNPGKRRERTVEFRSVKLITSGGFSADVGD